MSAAVSCVTALVVVFFTGLSVQENGCDSGSAVVDDVTTES
jgi:hypothetical protein